MADVLSTSEVARIRALVLYEGSGERWDAEELADSHEALRARLESADSALKSVRDELTVIAQALNEVAKTIPEYGGNGEFSKDDVENACMATTIAFEQIEMALGEEVGSSVAAALAAPVEGEKP